MKNILKHRIKITHFVPIFILLVISPLLSNNYQKVNQRRHLFFTLQKDNPSDLPLGTSGELFVKKDSPPVGTFKIIDQTENNYLCRLESIQKKGDPKIQWAVIRQKKPKIKRSSIQLDSFSFDPIPNVINLFLSSKPHMMKDISPLSTSGIKEYLFRMENLSGKKYSANLIAFESLQSMNLSRAFKSIGKQNILLGTRGGQICMIYRDGSGYQCSKISDETIGKFKNSLCFYIVLKKN